MRRLRVLLAILALAGLGAPGLVGEEAAGEEKPDRLVIKFRAGTCKSDGCIDVSRVAKVKDLTYRKDIATFTFTEGELYLRKPKSRYLTEEEEQRAEEKEAKEKGKKEDPYDRDDLYISHPEFTDYVEGAFFWGTGRIQMTPPDKVETHQLRRFTARETVDYEFDAAYIGFLGGADTEFWTGTTATMAALVGEEAGGETTEAPGGAAPAIRFEETGETEWSKERQQELKEFWKAVGRQGAGISLDNIFHYLKFGKVWGGEGAVSIAMRLTEKTKAGATRWLVFDYDPMNWKEVLLYQRNYIANTNNQYGTDIWCHFHKQADFAKSAVWREKEESKDVMKMRKVTSVVTVEKPGADTTFETTFTVEALIDDLDYLPFTLHPWCQIEKLTDGEGKAVDFYRPRVRLEKYFNWSLNLLLDEPMAKGETRTFHATYTTRKMIQERWDGYFNYSGFAWLPGYEHSFAFSGVQTDFTFKVPPEITVVSTGDLVREWEEGGYHCTRWVSDIPLAIPSFVYGEFDSHTQEVDLASGPVQVSAFSPKAGYVIRGSYTWFNPLTGFPVSRNHSGVWPTQKNLGAVAETTAEAMVYFNNIFGAYPWKNLSAVFDLLGGGQAPPTVTRLGYISFLNPTFLIQTLEYPASMVSWWSYELRSHETAHMWWGHIVQWCRNEDQWFSEGFAEYSAMLYVREKIGRLRGPEEGYKAFLEGLENHRYRLKNEHADVDGLGPLTLGHRRLNSSRRLPNGVPEGAAWGILPYNKGEYVLHMLNSMIQLLGGTEQDFLAMLRDFIEANRYVPVTTTDFKEAVERRFGGNDMTWFFDQWVYGTGIPDIEFTYDVTPTDDGKFLLTGRIKQKNTNFQMVMPVYFHFGKKEQAKQPVIVDKADYTFQMALPRRPDEVTLNDGLEVLAYVNGS